MSLRRLELLPQQRSLRHAVLITAHQDPEHLLALFNYFKGEFDIYLHLDKRSVQSEDWTEVLKHPSLQYVKTTYTPKWGSWSILESNMQLIQEALSNKKLDYFHLLSGQDFPTKSLDDLTNFIGRNPELIHIQLESLPVKHLAHGGRERYYLYHLNHWIDQRKHPNLHKRFLQLQKKLGLRRSLPASIPPLYLGSAWWSMPRAPLENIAEYTLKHPQFFKWLKYTKFPDELYLPTILADSEYAVNIRPGIRFIKWEKQNLGSPSVLTMEDLDAIQSSPHYFARKFGAVSKELRSQLAVSIRS